MWAGAGFDAAYSFTDKVTREADLHSNLLFMEGFF